MSMVIYTLRFWDDSGEDDLPTLDEVTNATDRLAQEDHNAEYDITVEHEGEAP